MEYLVMYCFFWYSYSGKEKKSCQGYSQDSFRTIILFTFYIVSYHGNKGSIQPRLVFPYKEERKVSLHQLYVCKVSERFCHYYKKYLYSVLSRHIPHLLLSLYGLLTTFGVDNTIIDSFLLTAPKKGFKPQQTPYDPES